MTYLPKNSYPLLNLFRVLSQRFDVDRDFARLDHHVTCHAL